MYTGRCLCDAVRYEADGPLHSMTHCHCSMCRKHHGAMFATFLIGPLAGFRWVAGEELLTRYQSSGSGHRAFCSRCGSAAPMPMPEMGIVFLLAGNLDADPGLRPEMHMFAASRADWYPITGPLPQHARFPPQFDGGSSVERPAPELKPGVAQGSCLCNETAWEFTGQPEFMQNCHCSRCRRARSAAHATNAFYKASQLTWVRGKDNVQSYALPDAKRFGQDFCRHCGSAVPRVIESTGYVVVPCGGFDSAPGIGPRGHIFASSKAPWFEITDGLPQWDGYPPRQ